MAENPIADVHQLQSGKILTADEIDALVSTPPGESANYAPMSETDAKIAAAEARTDTKFAELMGELRLINTRMEHVEKATSGIRLNIWLAAATAVGLVVAIFGYGSAMFGVGMDADSVARQAADRVSSQNTAEVQAIQTQLELQGQQINLIFEAISRSGGPSGTPQFAPLPAPQN